MKKKNETFTKIDLEQTGELGETITQEVRLFDNEALDDGYVCIDIVRRLKVEGKNDLTFSDATVARVMVMLNTEGSITLHVQRRGALPAMTPEEYAQLKAEEIDIDDLLPIFDCKETKIVLWDKAIKKRCEKDGE